jgi:hypothetical protein
VSAVVLQDSKRSLGSSVEDAILQCSIAVAAMMNKLAEKSD